MSAETPFRRRSVATHTERSDGAPSCTSSGRSGVWPASQCAESRIGETLEALVLSSSSIQAGSMDNLELAVALPGVEAQMPEMPPPQGCCSFRHSGRQGRAGANFDVRWRE